MLSSNGISRTNNIQKSIDLPLNTDTQEVGGLIGDGACHPNGAMHFRDTIDTL